MNRHDLLLFWSQAGNRSARYLWTEFGQDTPNFRHFLFCGYMVTAITETMMKIQLGAGDPGERYFAGEMLYDKWKIDHAWRENN